MGWAGQLAVRAVLMTEAMLSYVSLRSRLGAGESGFGETLEAQ